MMMVLTNQIGENRMEYIFGAEDDSYGKGMLLDKKSMEA